MATTDTVEIKFSLRDEISAAARKAVSEIMKVNDLRTDRARQQLNLMERASQGVGRELRSLATLSGITGFLGAGGLVAGLVAASKSLTDFAQQGIRTHYTARQLGISVDALESYTDGLKVLGQ